MAKTVSHHLKMTSFLCRFYFSTWLTKNSYILIFFLEWVHILGGRNTYHIQSRDAVKLRAHRRQDCFVPTRPGDPCLCRPTPIDVFIILHLWLWLRKRLPGEQSLVSPLLLPPPAPPCAGRLNHGPKHCRVPSCTRNKPRSHSSVPGGGGGGRCARDSWSEVDGVRGHLPTRHAPRIVRYTYSTDIAIQQASDGTKSNGMGMSETRTMHFQHQNSNSFRFAIR